DGIRDRNVTGVQTCALPIFVRFVWVWLPPYSVSHSTIPRGCGIDQEAFITHNSVMYATDTTSTFGFEHLFGDRGLGVRDILLLGLLVRHGQQPADAARDRVLGHRRVGHSAQLLQRRLPIRQPAITRHEQVLRNGLVEYLHRALDPGSRGHRGTGGATQVRIVEVRQAVRGRPHLTTYPAFLPGQHARMRAQPGQQRTNGVPIANHDTVDTAYLPGFRLHIEPARGPHQRERRLRAGTGDLERRGSAGLGERTVRKERTTPGGFGLRDTSRNDGGGQPTHRTATRVDQAGLPSQPVTVLDHAHHVPGALTQPTRGRDDMNIGVVTVEIVNLLAQPT